MGAHLLAALCWLAFAAALGAAFSIIPVAVPPAAAATPHRPVQVETLVRPDTVQLGEAVRLRYRVWLPKGSSVAFPGQPADDSLHHWTEWTTQTLKSKGDLREHRLTARFQTFALGAVDVPGVPLRFRIPGEEAREGRFPTARFVVLASVPSGGPEPPIRDLKGLIAPPWWALVPWLWVAVGAILIALAVWGIRRWLRRRRVALPAKAGAAPLDPPHVEAKRRLEALIALRLPEAGRVLDHGVELADLLHRFVERRFGTPEPGHTTSELARHLIVRADVDPGDVDALRDLLEACDLTKFARRPYDAARAHEAERTAARLIDAWTERPAAEERVDAMA